MAATPIDSTKRFSDRVANYVKYRPRYPQAIIPYLERQIGLTSDTIIADVGSGTGILTELFLDHGNFVYGVEPNEPMRSAAEDLLSSYECFTSIDGTAEATTLTEESVNLIVAGQAFHWFEPSKARAEFARILMPGGYVALIWNSRLRKGPFMHAYEELLFTYADDYKSVGDRNVTDEHIGTFFAPQQMTLHTFAHYQMFDFAGLKGRALSSSYAPVAEHPRHEAFIEHLKQLFDNHQEDGIVSVDYKTRVYSGQL
ncbi:MAG: methyltransferase domain-containing protein [Chloroflexota bacterium]